MLIVFYRTDRFLPEPLNSHVIIVTVSYLKASSKK
uniref:Uncharacterized protein n=1 Tax=Anguilla anguilla TaxID=7936 RepID=A0A0E9TU87_ANGAN